VLTVSGSRIQHKRGAVQRDFSAAAFGCQARISVNLFNPADAAGWTIDSITKIYLIAIRSSGMPRGGHINTLTPFPGDAPGTD